MALLSNEQCYVLLKNHIRIIISSEMNWVGHVKCVREARNTYVV